MGFDSVCNKGLVLELGLSSSMMENSIINTTKKLCNNKTFDPSLSLALSSDHGGLYRQDSVSGGGSSFSVASHVSVKREREVKSEDSERAMISASIDHEIEEEEEEIDDVNGRKKLRLTKAQSALLEEAFIHQSTLNPKQKQELARELKLRPRQVEVWFQNRRARTKLKQTEVECGYLKKCCEALKEENTKLHKELQQLKAQPFYMQLPVATLTMCPSCERIGGTTSTTVSSKPHFFHPFTNNPSAAC